MDLNDLYSRHQISLMRAAAATSQQALLNHMMCANKLALKIRDFQISKAAPAAYSWSNNALLENRTPAREMSWATGRSA
jgi:hypothetical protein